MSHHEQDQHEPGQHETKAESFMRTMGHLRGLYGPADHLSAEEAERHGHNPEDVKEEQELAGIDVETDSEGHHYGVRKSDSGE